MSTIIAKNISGVNLLIDDMGIFLAAGESRDLTATFLKVDVTKSLDLYTYINENKIILNDGVADLTQEESLNTVIIQTVQEEVTSVPTDHSNDVVQFIFDSDGTTTGRTRISSATSWVTICKFIFKGSYNGIIPSFKICAATEKYNRQGYISLCDITNNKWIFDTTILGTTPTIYEINNVSGITTNQSIFELKGCCQVANDDLYIYSFLTQFS
jgi:hypothetical protein